MRRKTNEEFIKEVNSLVGNEYNVLENYTNARTKILMKHNSCEYVWRVKPQHFITSGSRCPKCTKHRVRTKEEFIEELKILGKNEFSLISDYINVNIKVRLQHICQYEWDLAPYSFLAKGLRCPKCDSNIRNRDLDYFQKEVFEIVREEYSVLGEYINTKTHILMRHNKCNHEYHVVPSSFLCGRRCPNCNTSKGEELIKTYLNTKNINFKMEFSFDDCKNKQSLFFDFAIFDEDNNLKCLIEYDGSQHFSPKFGEDKLLYTQKNDSIKNEYCRMKDIKLIRIPYWEQKNIKKILNNEL